MLETTDNGDVLVSLPGAGRVVLLKRDDNGDGKTDGQIELISDLSRPHGLDIFDGWLYIAEADALGKIEFDSKNRTTAGVFEQFITGLPRGGDHWTRSVKSVRMDEFTSLSAQVVMPVLKLTRAGQRYCALTWTVPKVKFSQPG